MFWMKSWVALSAITVLVALSAGAMVPVPDAPAAPEKETTIEHEHSTAVPQREPAAPHQESVAPAAPASPTPATKPYKTVTRVATAEGLTAATAIANALDEAILQVNGTVLRGDRAIRSKYDTSRHHLRSLAESGDESKIQFAAYGLIETYEVLEQTTDPQSGIVTVKLKVEVPQYDDTLWRWGGRRTIAVIPFRDRSELGQPEGQRPFSSSSFIRAMTHDLVTLLVNSQKFIVLDREYTSEWEHELTLIESEKTPMAEKAKIAQAMGADFLLIGSLEGLELVSWTEVVKITNYQQTHRMALASLDYRLLNVATTQVEWAGAAKAIVGDEELAQLPQGSSEQRTLEPLAKDVAFRISSEVLEALFPIKVVRVGADGRVILNQGGLRMALGERFDVFRQGEALIDPDTGETLGREETRLAQLEVVRVEPKVSYTRVVEGSVAGIEPGAVCRGLRFSPPPQPPQPAQP